MKYLITYTNNEHKIVDTKNEVAAAVTKDSLGMIEHVFELGQEFDVRLKTVSVWSPL